VHRTVVAYLLESLTLSESDIILVLEQQAAKTFA
jgi:hypothetical protein